MRFFFAFLRLVLSFFFWKIFFSGFLASPAHLAEPWKVVASGPWKVFCRRFLLSLKCSCCWKIFKKRQKHEFFGKAAHLSPIWLLCFTTPGHPKKWLPPQGKILWCGIRNPGPKGRKKTHRTSFYAAKYLRTRKYTMQKAKRKKKNDLAEIPWKNFANVAKRVFWCRFSRSATLMAVFRQQNKNKKNCFSEALLFWFCKF